MRGTTGLADEHLQRGEIVRLLLRLGRSGATGVLSLAAPGAATSDVLVLRRGHLITTDVDLTGRHATLRLARLAAAPSLVARFDGGTAAYPPGAARQLSLVTWVRRHLEAQIDATAGQQLVAELAGVRLCVRPDAGLLEPGAAALFGFDETDQRILTAMSQPRRLDQIWSLARTPRFRLLTFLHFLRAVGALQLSGVGADSRPNVAPPRAADTDARRLLGVPDEADREAIKRAYRRLARALHPDLQPELDDGRRRALERKLAEITAAYATLA